MTRDEMAMAARGWPRLMNDLDEERRQTVEAIVSRSAHNDATARILDQALALLHVRAEGAVTHFLTVLELAMVHVLVRDPENWSSVLVLDDADGRSHIGVFSSDDQAQIAAQHYDASYRAIPIDVVLLCECLDGEVGLAFNPHDEVLSFELSPEIFHQFQDAVFEHGEPEPGAYYSVLEGEGGYQCLRVLALGETIMAEGMRMGWPMRPRSLSLSTCEGLPREKRELSRDGFQQIHPLRIGEVVSE